MKKEQIFVKDIPFVIKFPTSWHDMTADQIAHALRLLYAENIIPTKLEWKNDWIILQIMKAVTGLTDDFIEKYKQEIGDDTQFFAQLQIWLGYFDFMFTPEKDQLACNLYRNPLPEFRIKQNGSIITLCAGHSDEKEPFRDAHFEEMVQIFNFHREYVETRKETALDQLMAVYYRPKTKKRQSDDWRAPLEPSKFKIEARANALKKQFPTALKRVVFLHITSAINLFQSFYPEVFSNEEKTAGNGDWIDFVLSLTDYAVDAYSIVASKPAHDVFTVACRTIRHQKAAKA